MRPIQIDGATRRLGAPASWDHSKGICHTLEIIDQDGWMISAWMPNQKEIEQIKNGLPILLYIQGVMHPVVVMAVGGGGE